MNSAPEQFELIEQYLKGKLSDPDKFAFENRMKEDPSFTEEVAMQKALNALIFEKGLADIRKKVGEDMPPPKGPSSFSKPLLFSLLAILLTVSALYFFRGTGTEPEAPATKPSLSEAPSSAAAERFGEEAVHPSKKKPHPFKEDRSPIPERRDDGSDEEDLAEPAIRKQANPGDNQDTSLAAPAVDPHKEEARPVPEKENHKVQPHPESQQGDIPCPSISFEAVTEPACKNKSTGSIEIAGARIQGGEGPYSYSINGVDHRAEQKFTALAAGKYLVSVRDSRGCVAEKDILISEKACMEFQDYSFRPEAESWTLPFSEHESGAITITTKSGKVVYTAQVMNGNPYSWNGRSDNGEALPTGTYVYVAQTTKGEIRQGYIVILH